MKAVTVIAGTNHVNVLGRRINYPAVCAPPKLVSWDIDQPKALLFGTLGSHSLYLQRL
jgi:hypothetical protein